MINPTPRDIDRRVISIHGENAAGRIVGFDDRYVYVAFNADSAVGAPFARDELVWFSGKDRA